MFPEQPVPAAQSVYLGVLTSLRASAAHISYFKCRYKVVLRRILELRRVSGSKKQVDVEHMVERNMPASRRLRN